MPKSNGIKSERSKILCINCKLCTTLKLTTNTGGSISQLTAAHFVGGHILGNYVATAEPTGFAITTLIT
jgi:hypothetical protein